MEEGGEKLAHVLESALEARRGDAEQREGKFVTGEKAGDAAFIFAHEVVEGDVVELGVFDGGLE